MLVTRKQRGEIDNLNMVEQNIIGNITEKSVTMQQNWSLFLSLNILLRYKVKQHAE